MKLITELFTDKINALIYEHNGHCRINSMLATHEDANTIIKAMLLNGGDRFVFDHRCNQISHELTPIIHEMFHGKKVLVKKQNGQDVVGVIRHNLQRTYEGRTFTNETSMRSMSDNGGYTWYKDTETIALWVDTGDKHTSHLYNTNLMYLIEDDSI